MIYFVFYLWWLQKQLVEVCQVWLDGQQNAAVDGVASLKALRIHHPIHPAVNQFIRNALSVCVRPSSRSQRKRNDTESLTRSRCYFNSFRTHTGRLISNNVSRTWIPFTMQLSVLSPENIFCNSCSTHSCLQEHRQCVTATNILIEFVSESVCVCMNMFDSRLEHCQQRIGLRHLLQLIGLVSAQPNDVTQSLRCIGLPL